MFIRMLVLSQLFLFMLLPVRAQEDVTLFNYWKYYLDAENSLYKYFCSVAFEQLGSRETAVGKLVTKADWLERQKMVRKKLLGIIGPLPERTPLNIRITGTIQRDGYRVEKLIYESRPGYFVTSALFIPDNLSAKAPGILNPIGHSPLSFRRDVYQHTIINLVKKGFVVLAYDPIGQGERLQYYDEEAGKSVFPTNHEHSYPGAQCFISGYSPAKYFIWDAIRGLDVLVSRPEVDAERVGMTGISGGGNITAYLSALDDRIFAAAPECWITNYNYLFRSEGPQDAEQNLVRFIYNGLDHPDFIELRAPKPTLIMSTTRDFFSIQGARETFHEARRAFAALGAADNLQMTEEDAPHSFTKKNREAMYAFFQKHLHNPGDSTDHEVEVIPVDELWVTETGQLATSLKGETMYSLNKKVVARQLSALDSSRAHAEAHLSKVTQVAREISGFSFPEDFGSPVFSGRYVKDAYTLEKYLIPGSGDYMLPLVLLIPKEDVKREVILLLHENGKNYAVNSDSLARQLLSDGYTVLLGDLPDIGELGPGYLKGDTYIRGISYNKWFAGILTGRSIVGLRAEDIIRMTRFIKTNLSGYHSLTAISVGVLGSELLHAAVFDSAIQQVCLVRPFLGFSNIALSHDYKPSYIFSTVPGAIEEYDLPDLMAALCPEKTLIINPLLANGVKVGETKVGQTMRFPFKVYANNNSSDNFILKTEVNDEKVAGYVLSWLKRAGLVPD